MLGGVGVGSGRGASVREKNITSLEGSKEDILAPFHLRTSHLQKELRPLSLASQSVGNDFRSNGTLPGSCQPKAKAEAERREIEKERERERDREKERERERKRERERPRERERERERKKKKRERGGLKKRALGAF